MNYNSEFVERYFPIVRVTQLNIQQFKEYIPKTHKQYRLKEEIVWLLSLRVYRDFRKSILDPSIDSKGNIIFLRGLDPAVGQTMQWWYWNAQSFMPEKCSRLGQSHHYVLFLAYIIHTRIEEGYSPDEIWSEVCDKSAKLGNYKDSVFASDELEKTASRLAGNWYDLGNTNKLLLSEFCYGFEIAGGNYTNLSSQSPLGTKTKTALTDRILKNAVGWIILDV